MTQSILFDLVKCFSTTVGTGTLTIGPAAAAFLNFTTGGVNSGDTVSYTIFDGPLPAVGLINASETGQGVATNTAGVWTLTRIVRKSTNGDQAINCTGKEIVALTLAAEDLNLSGGPFLPLATGGTVLGPVIAPISGSSVISDLGTTSRTTADRAGDWLNVKDFVADPNNCLNGTADDTSAWLAVVAEAASRGGATITAPYGCTSLVTANIVVNSSNIRFYLPNVTMKPSGPTITRLFDFEGTTGNGPVISQDVAAYSNTITVSALNNAVAGSYVLFSRAAVVPAGLGDQYRFVAFIRSVSGTGPFVLQLNSVMPFSITAGDPTIVNSRLIPLINCGVSGGVIIDGSGHVGTDPLHGVYHVDCVKTVIRDIKAINLTTGSIVFGFTGQHNLVENIEGVNCGSQNFAAIQLTGQSNSQCNHIRLEQSSGFGVVLSSWSYGTGTGFITQGSYGSGRGFKLQAGLFNNLSNFVSNFNHSNGVAVAVASCHNTFSGISANGNIEFEGVWLSDQNNLFNTFYGINAFGNTSRDLYIGTTDLNNMFFGANVGVLENHAGTSTAFFTQGQPPNTIFPTIDITNGPLILGNDTLSPLLEMHIDAAAGSTRTIKFDTAGLPRWSMTCNAAPESGGNNGSDFTIGRWDDGGISLTVDFSLLRVDGTARFASGVRIAAGLGLWGSAILSAQPTVNGSISDLTATGALHSLLAQLAAYGLYINNTTP